MSKKVIMLNGSRRKNNTYNMLLQVEKVLNEHGFETEILHLFDYEIKDCVGCECCVQKEKCFISDDMDALMQKISECDGVVFSSPVYMCSVTSRFKAFADRTNRFIHKPELVGMPAMFVTTTAATGIKETERFFDLYANGLGVRKGSFISRAGKKMRAPVKEKELSKFLSLLKKDKAKYRPSMKEIIMFNVGRVMALKSTGDDNRFWKEKEWTDKTYYYKCKMNPFKKLFSKFMFKVLTKAMK